MQSHTGCGKSASCSGHNAPHVPKDKQKFGIIFYGSQIGRPQNHFILHSFLVYVIAPAARSAPSAKSTRCARPSLSGGPPARTRTNGNRKYSPGHWKPPSNNPCQTYKPPRAFPSHTTYRDEPLQAGTHAPQSYCRARSHSRDTPSPEHLCRNHIRMHFRTVLFIQRNQRNPSLQFLRNQVIFILAETPYIPPSEVYPASVFPLIPSTDSTVSIKSSEDTG